MIGRPYRALPDWPVRRIGVIGELKVGIRRPIGCLYPPRHV
jgi:hypothetical protein